MTEKTRERDIMERLEIKIRPFTRELKYYFNEIMVDALKGIEDVTFLYVSGKANYEETKQRFTQETVHVIERPASQPLVENRWCRWIFF